MNELKPAGWYFDVFLLNSLLSLIRISEIDAMRQADIVGTCRNKFHIYPVMAEVTLLRYAFVLAKRNGIIRTYFNIRLTSGLLIVIHDYNAIVPFYNSFFRKGFRTRGALQCLHKLT